MIDRLPSERLARRCDPDSFAFETTAELAGVDEVIGQERADRAVEFGVAIRRDGYNLFVMGPTGSGKRTLVRKRIAAHAADAESPSDWVYVNNFDEPQKPIAIGLPPGRGAALRRDMENLVDELRDAIPAVFDSEEYSTKVESLDAEFNERHEREFTALGEEATQQKIALLRMPSGFSFAPVRDGEVLTPEEFAKLPEEERQRIQTAIAALQVKLEKAGARSHAVAQGARRAHQSPQSRDDPARGRARRRRPRGALPGHGSGGRVSRIGTARCARPCR